jgi:hypothetical protein
VAPGLMTQRPARVGQENIGELRSGRNGVMWQGDCKKKSARTTSLFVNLRESSSASPSEQSALLSLSPSISSISVATVRV